MGIQELAKMAGRETTARWVKRGLLALSVTLPGCAGLNESPPYLKPETGAVCQTISSYRELDPFSQPPPPYERCDPPQYPAGAEGSVPGGRPPNPNLSLPKPRPAATLYPVDHLDVSRSFIMRPLQQGDDLLYRLEGQQKPLFGQQAELHFVMEGRGDGKWELLFGKDRAKWENGQLTVGQPLSGQLGNMAQTAHELQEFGKYLDGWVNFINVATPELIKENAVALPLTKTWPNGAAQITGTTLPSLPGTTVSFRLRQTGSSLELSGHAYDNKTQEVYELPRTPVSLNAGKLHLEQPIWRRQDPSGTVLVPFSKEMNSETKTLVRRLLDAIKQAPHLQIAPENLTPAPIAPNERPSTPIPPPPPNQVISL